MRSYYMILILIFAMALMACSGAGGGSSPHGDFTTQLSGKILVMGTEDTEPLLYIGDAAQITVTTESNTYYYSTADWAATEDAGEYLIPDIDHHGSFLVEISLLGISNVTLRQSVETSSSTLEQDFIVNLDCAYTSILDFKVMDPSVSDGLGGWQEIQNAQVSITGGDTREFGEIDGQYYVMHNGDISVQIDSNGYLPFSGVVEIQTDSGKTDEVAVSLFKPDSQSTTVNGILYFGNSNNLLEGARISSSLSPDSIYCYSDSTGNFSLNVPHYGVFEIYVTREDMQTCTEEFETDNDFDSLGAHYSVPVNPDYWTYVTGFVYKEDGTTPLRNAYVELGDFDDYTYAEGSFLGIYAKKGQDNFMKITADGYKTIITLVDISENEVEKTFTMEKEVSGSVSVSGSIQDSYTGNYITDDSLTVSVDVTQASVSGGGYSATVENLDGTFIITAVALGYNIYSWSIETTDGSYDHDIALNKSLASPVTTNFSGYIKDQDGNVPNDLENITLAINAVPATIDKITGAYTCTVSTNLGSVIVQCAGSLDYYPLVRTVYTDDSYWSYNVVVTAK